MALHASSKLEKLERRLTGDRGIAGPVLPSLGAPQETPAPVPAPSAPQHHQGSLQMEQSNTPLSLQQRQGSSARRKRSTPEQRLPSVPALQPGAALPRPVQAGGDASEEQALMQGSELQHQHSGLSNGPGSNANKRARSCASPLEQHPQQQRRESSPGVIIIDGSSNHAAAAAAQPAGTLPHHLQQQQLNAPTPTRCLFGPPTTAANNSHAATKPTPRSAQKQGGSGGKTSGSGQHGARSQQTKLNSYYPVLDSSSRDSDLSGGAQQQGQQHAPHHAPHQPSNLHHASGPSTHAAPTTSAPYTHAQPPSTTLPTHLQATAQTAHTAQGGAAPEGVQYHTPHTATATATTTQPPAQGAAPTHAAPPSTTQQHAAHGSSHGQLSLGRATSYPCVQHHGHSHGGQGHSTTCGLTGEATVMSSSSAADRAMVEGQAQVIAKLQSQLESKDRQIAALQEQHSQSEAALSSRLAASVAEVASLASRLSEAAVEAETKARGHAEREAKLRSELVRSLQSGQRTERELTRLQLAAQGVRLGCVAIERTGLSLQEVWRDGEAFVALFHKQQSLAVQRESVESARKALRKKLPPPPARAFGGPSTSAATNSSSAGGSGSSTGEDGAMEGGEFVALDDVYKSRLAVLKREEDSVKEEADRLNSEKRRHVRALKRMWDESGSKFGNSNVVLGGRFVLLSLLGKGGFSEVFRAYDLLTMRIVAAKVHQLSPAWSEAKKASYVKHAIREVNIQKQMRHPHVVSLVDVLEISNESFATVLEYCEGGDLDSLLRDHGALPEREARSLLQQMFAGLVYLNQPGRRVIHYDLKPANILFDTLGTAKITDFGLSKVVADGETMGMELTSQGAGTYWYLPPECFETNSAPRISNKVDVWSMGVIFYQMLYGRRPFGEGMTQEAMARQGVLLNATQVEFPSKPTLSAEAKEFIRRCLAHRQEARWDVLTAAQDPYLIGPSGKK